MIKWLPLFHISKLHASREKQRPAVSNGLDFPSLLDGHHHIGPECPVVFRGQKEDSVFVCFGGSLVGEPSNGPRIQRAFM